MSKLEPELDVRAFAAWLKQRRGDDDTNTGRVPGEALRLAAARMWEQVQAGRTEAGRLHAVPMKLAAADGQGEQQPLEIQTEYGLIEFMRIGMTDRWRVLFRAEPTRIDALRGRRLKLHMAAEDVLLSEIDDRGLARVDLPVGLTPGDLPVLELQ